ncbi:hypothetical protein GE09DRAFT_1061283 [Coniochaeta sp. 2T2.1]|nr:hypothetical protein GE09DRAFT_1061283 [Coniochaeta sp. 2T2.1]
MSSPGTLRAALLPIFAACALVGGYAGMYMSGVNGAMESSKNSAGRPVDPYISGGVHPFKNSYTGVKAVDEVLLVLVPFFAYILDTPQSWAIRASFWYLMINFFAATSVIFLEGQRRGNAGRLVSWVGTVGFIFQNISYTIAGPIWTALYLFTSPIASPSVTASDVLPSDALEPKTLLLSNFLAYAVPAIGMLLPAHSVVSAETHYNWIATWQFFPVLYAVFQFILTRAFSTLGLFGSSPRQTGRSTSALSTAVVYRTALFITVTTHLTLLAVALTPASAIPAGFPTLSKIFREVSFKSAFLPPDIFSPPSVDPKIIPADKLAPLTHFFLMWDVNIGNFALLLWAVYLRLVAGRERGGQFSGTGVLVKAAGWTAIGGPIAAVAALLWERDEVLVTRAGNAGVGRKKRM